MCLLISNDVEKIQVIGQELVVENEDDYTVDLVHFVISEAVATQEIFKEQNDLFLRNSPNPFGSENRSETSISFDLLSDSEIELEIFNIKGQLIKKLASSRVGSGSHSFVWNGKDSYEKQTPPGIYFYRLRSNSRNVVKKMILVR